jgi:hypothetical protein
LCAVGHKFSRAETELDPFVSADSLSFDTHSEALKNTLRKAQDVEFSRIRKYQDSHGFWKMEAEQNAPIQEPASKWARPNLQLKFGDAIL